MNRTGLLIALSLALVIGLLFGIYPELDLKLAALFYDPVAKTFPLKFNTLAAIARDGAMWISWGLALPAIAGRGKALIMRAWEFGAPLDRGQWGIREPKPDAPEVEPDILLVPLLAFDRAGHRLGYGAGYYDMTIHRLRGLKPVTAVGVAFAAQEVPKIPTTPRDERLDLVLTEREIIDLRA